MPLSTTKREVLVALVSGTFGLIGGTASAFTGAYVQRQEHGKEQKRMLFGKINEKHIALRQHIDQYENTVRLWVRDLIQKTKKSPGKPLQMSEIRGMQTFEDVINHVSESNHIVREYSGAAIQAQDLFEGAVQEKFAKIVRLIDRFVSMEKQTADFLIELIEETPVPTSGSASKFFREDIKPRIRHHLDIALRQMEDLINEIRNVFAL